MAGYTTPSWTNNSSPALNAANMTAIGQGIEIAEHPYGVCSTAASTKAKTVTIDYSGSLTLFTGLTIRVKFNNANTNSAPTLNVNGTGAKSIMARGTTPAGNGAWSAGSVVILTYDGSFWQISGSAQSSPFIVSNTAPGDTTKLWIDPSNGLKYYNGTAWVIVPVGYST